MRCCAPRPSSRCRWWFAGLVVLAVQGIAMYAVMAMLEKRMTGWAHRSGFAGA